MAISDTSQRTSLRLGSKWVTGVAVAGVAWSLFGAFQFVTNTFSRPEQIMQKGTTAEQAAVYAAVPIWLTVSFAVGVFGGVLAARLLLARRAASGTRFVRWG